MVRAGVVGTTWKSTRRCGLAGLTVLLSLGLALGPATAATAHHTHQVVKILGSGDPGGLDGGRYLGEFWAGFYGTAVDQLPDCARLGPHDRVLYVPGLAAVCTTREGDPLFVEGLSAAISNLEDPFSSDAATQLQTARDFDYGAALEIHLAIDGGTPVDLRVPRFEVVTRQQTVQLPENSIFGPGVEPQVVTLTAHGWLATVRGLRPGLHHIVRTGVFDFGDGPTAETYDQTLRVLPRNH
jgi:hypothetical protein